MNDNLDRLTVEYGKEVYSTRYNTFTIGPFQLSTTVKEGETYEEAFSRCYVFLEKMARDTYIQRREVFYDRMGYK